jgi:hypothetical protein
MAPCFGIFSQRKVLNKSVVTGFENLRRTLVTLAVFDHQVDWDFLKNHGPLNQPNESVFV